MTAFFSALFRMLTKTVTHTEALVDGYGSICRTARTHAEAFEKESTIEAEAKLRELEKQLNSPALEHNA